MTIDELRAKAKAAKAWRPSHWCSFNGVAWRHNCGARDDGTFEQSCASCQGAQRAVEYIEDAVDFALLHAENSTHVELAEEHHIKAFKDVAIEEATDAEKFESCFGAPGPVAEFRDAVVEFCK